MNKIFTILCVCLLMTCWQASAQVNGCGDGRYVGPEYFADIDSVMGILFGSNTQVGGTGQQQLKMDIYMPANDTVAERPVIVMAFGGSFITGSRDQVAPLCREFAHRGYVAVTIDYRVGFFFPSRKTTLQAVMRGVHDMRAAIRFLHKDVEQVGNTYGIDTSMIIAGGVSAGAITAIHAAYLDDTSEVPNDLASDFDALGGLEGNSGTPGFPSTIHAVVSFSGTIGDSLWITSGAQPIVMLHEDGDDVVPIGSGPVSVGGIPTGLDADGSSSIRFRVDNLGIPYDYKEYQANSHVGYLQGTKAEQDTAVNLAANFLNDMVVCKDFIDTGIADELNLTAASFQIQPNPTSGVVQLSLNAGQIGHDTYTLEVFDMIGRSMISRPFTNNELIDLSTLQKGLYVFKLTPEAGTGTAFAQKIILTN